MKLPEYESKPGVLQRRLGEHLQAEGLLTAEQLDAAIEYQCIYGGKLGTSLIELGLISEDQLAQILSRQLKLPYIKPELLMNVPGSILSLIPRKLALKHQIVPYHEDGKKLFVATNEFANLSGIDELSFQLDHIIVPLAIPEIRIMLALKKHYGMLLSPRYETLAGQLNRRMLAARKIADKKQAVNTPETEPVDQPIHKESPEDEAAWPLLGDAPYEEEVDESYFAEVASGHDDSPTGLLHKLANAQDRNDIARAVLQFLKKDFPVSALLMVRENSVSGWMASSENQDQHFEQINIPTQDRSVFNLVVTSRSPYLGPVTDSLQNLKILDYFNSPRPQNALVIPLTVRDRLVSILYIQGEIELLERRFADIQTFAGKAEMSFKLLILRNKILTA